MSKKTPAPSLRRWSILDRSGKTRGTCTATTKAEARTAFNMRGIGLTATGWKIVDRGPVKGGETVTNLQAGPIFIPKAKVESVQAKPRPFKVGDRVRWKTGLTGPVMEGVIRRIDDAGGVHFTVEDDPARRWAKPANLTLVETGARWADPKGILAAIRQATGIPASEQPDLVEAVRSIASQMDRHRQERDRAQGMLAAAIDQSTDLAGRFQDAFGLPGASWPELVAHAKQARQVRDDLKAMREFDAKTIKHLKDQCHANNARLDDFAALVRAMRLIAQVEGQNPLAAMQAILDRP